MSSRVSGVLGDWLTFSNGASGSYSDAGPYPVYGANGVYARASDSNLATAGVVIGRVGSYCGSVHYSPTPAWVSENALIATPRSGSTSRFWGFALSSLDLNSWRGGSGQPLLNQSILRNIPFVAPSVPEQQAIAEVLGAVDDKIAANTALAANTGSVAMVEYRSAIRDGGLELPIDEVSILLARGITPRYLPDGDGTRVLNQKCVRDQLVSLEPSRWTDDAKVKQEKLLAVGDILVNSTGQGTLGRVARWTLSQRVTVDSHITIVRPDSDVNDPAVIGQAILAIEADIEALGEGSTGQTELSRVELGRARVRIPSRERAEPLGAKLRALSACQDAARAENDTLAATRDALLPQLMSGKLRVRDAEDLIVEAGV